MRTVNDLSLDELRKVVSLIQDALNGLVWSPDTMDIIANILREAGLKIADAE
jgi:hypothetical protein